MPIETTIAYALLTIACCSGVVAAYTFHTDDYFFVPILLLAALGANVARRVFVPFTFETLAVDALFIDRLLFFVWPIGVIALLCIAFDRLRLLRFAVLPLLGFFTTFLFLVPEWFGGGFVRVISQCVSGAGGILAIVLLVLRGKRAAFLSPLEMAAFFCGIAECLAAVVGYFVHGKWWPALAVYCVLYLALVLLHVRMLWTRRQMQQNSLESQSR